MLALLRFALNSSIFVDHNEFLDELTLSFILKTTLRVDNFDTDKKVYPHFDRSVIINNLKKRQ